MSKSEKEAAMQYAIATHLGEKNIVIPNVSFARTSCRIPKYGDGEVIGYEYPFKGICHEADLIWINENDYLTEVEIKAKKVAEYFKVEKIPVEVKIGLMRIGCQKWWRRK